MQNYKEVGVQEDVPNAPSQQVLVIVTAHLHIRPMTVPFLENHNVPQDACELVTVAYV